MLAHNCLEALGDGAALRGTDDPLLYATAQARPASGIFLAGYLLTWIALLTIMVAAEKPLPFGRWFAFLSPVLGILLVRVVITLILRCSFARIGRENREPCMHRWFRTKPPSIEEFLDGQNLPVPSIQF